jgi:hypothetical protein
MLAVQDFGVDVAVKDAVRMMCLVLAVDILDESVNRCSAGNAICIVVVVDDRECGCVLCCVVVHPFPFPSTPPPVLDSYLSYIIPLPINF